MAAHSDLYIVDNSGTEKTVLKYLSEWCTVSRQMDIATGYLEIGGLLALDGAWQKMDKIRILLGNEMTQRTKDVLDTLADYIVDESTIAPSERVSQENLFEDIQRMLKQLSPKERDILILRYGLDNNGEKKTLDEIGSHYGVSRERIRQIENRAISKLKKLCKNANLTVDLKNYFGN